MAPEAVRKEKCDLFKVDMWAVGIIYYSLLKMKYPFQGRNRKEIHEEILNKPVDMEGLGSIDRKVISLLLNKDPSKRVSSR